MTVGIVGGGPAAAAVETALGDIDAETGRRNASTLEQLELAVVVGRTGEGVFEQVNEQVLNTEMGWIAVELGGLGGVPVVDAAVAGFGPETGCYACLTGRVSANLDETPGERAPEIPAHVARFVGAVAGREVVRVLEGKLEIFGRAVEIPHAKRQFLPLPNCTCDRSRDPAIRRGHTERTVEESIARAERALDDRLGIVQEVGEAESFPVPYYLARSCDTTGFSDVSAARDAAGVALDWNGAFMKALGEALERYCAGVYRTANFETGTPSQVEGAVPPSAFVCQSTPKGEAIEWVPGENLSTGENVMVPAEFVYFPPPSRRYRSPVTTGLGLGNGGAGALLSGLYEVIERDATMLSWYSTFEPLGLAVEDERFETLVARARSENLTVSPLLLTQDVDVPVVAVAVRGESWPRLALGSDADLDVTRAARSALAEALQNWMELRGMGENEADGALGEIGRYASEPTPAVEFVEPETTIPAESVGPSEPPAGENELAAVLDRVERAGLDAYAVRTTTRDVETLGFEAVRVLIPSAQPLCFGEIYFGERARTVPDTLGFTPELGRAHHPFP